MGAVVDFLVDDKSQWQKRCLANINHTVRRMFNPVDDMMKTRLSEKYLCIPQQGHYSHSVLASDM